jgi:hypothetical protein
VQVAARDGTLVVAQMSAQEAGGLRPGASVMVTILDMPVFATAV